MHQTSGCPAHTSSARGLRESRSVSLDEQESRKRGHTPTNATQSRRLPVQGKPLLRIFVSSCWRNAIDCVRVKCMETFSLVPALSCCGSEMCEVQLVPVTYL